MNALASRVQKGNIVATLTEIEDQLYLTDCQNSRKENGSESVNLDVFSLGESVFNQELLHFVALVTLKLKNVASISSVGNNGTVAAVGLQFVRLKGSKISKKMHALPFSEPSAPFQDRLRG